MEDVGKGSDAETMATGGVDSAADKEEDISVVNDAHKERGSKVGETSILEQGNSVDQVAPQSPPKRDAVVTASPPPASGHAKTVALGSGVDSNSGSEEKTNFSRAATFEFPGHDAPTKRGRNLYAAAFLDSMFTDTRLKQIERSSSSCTVSASWWISWFFVLVYLPVGIVLTILRVGIFFPLGGLLHMVTPKCMHTLLFRCVACCCFGNVYRYRRASIDGDDEGLINAAEEDLPPARIIVANHTTEMDVMPIRARGSLRIMGYDMYTKMCWLQYSPLRFLDMLYIKQTERSAGGGKDRDAVREQVKSGLAEPGSPPLLVFPEGGLTTGRRGLLQFHKFLFSLGYVVQPVSIRAHGGPLPINLDNNMGTTWGNILSYTFQPWQVFTVTYLPPQQIRPNETPLQFAHRVMRLIAFHSRDIVASPFLYRDKRIYSKMKMRLYREGFTYRFVGTLDTPRSGRVHPEDASIKDEPEVVVTRSCFGCGRLPHWEGDDGTVSPADYLASQIDQAFTGENGEALGSGTIGGREAKMPPV